jgi:hypothetical protein
MASGQLGYEIRVQERFTTPHWAVGLVRGEDNRLGFVELGYQLKEGVRAFIAEWKIPDLVHDQKLELSQPLDIFLQPILPFRFDQVFYQRAGIGKIYSRNWR